MKSRLVAACLTTALVFSLCMIGCSQSGTTTDHSTESEPIYLPSKIVGYSDDRVVTTEFSYDEHGSLTQVVQDWKHTSNKSADAVDTHVLDFDSQGLPISISSAQSNQDNDTTTIEQGLSAEVDAEGRYIELATEGHSMRYEYAEDGHISKTTSTYDFNDSSSWVSYDEGGWAIESDFGPYDLKRDSSGNVTGREYLSAAGKKVLEGYTLDENGNVISISRNSATIFEVEYVEITNPSPASRSFANLKFNGSNLVYDLASLYYR